MISFWYVDVAMRSSNESVCWCTNLPILQPNAIDFVVVSKCRVSPDIVHYIRRLHHQTIVLPNFVNTQSTQTLE